MKGSAEEVTVFFYTAYYPSSLFGQEKKIFPRSFSLSYSIIIIYNYCNFHY